MSEQPRRLDVVLDVLDEGDQYRVVMVGVYEPGARRPPPREGAYRNVVQTWEGVDHHVRAFALPAPSHPGPVTEGGGP